MKRKKILFVTNHFRFSNGVASVLRSLIDNIDQNRFDIHLLTLYEFNEEFAAPIKGKATFHKGFGFYFRGFDQITKHIPLKWLYKAFVHEDYDLEVAFQFGLPTKMISVSPNPNKICWMHGYDTHMILKNYYLSYNHIITVSKVATNKLAKDGFPHDFSDFCYNIIDEDDIISKSGQEMGLKKRKRHLVITVGRQSPEKAGVRQLKCIKEILQKIEDCEFWIIGDGIEFNKMQVCLQENGLRDSVKLLGKQSNPYKYMNQADLYFCGSLREGFSTACQEAALLGIPVISTDVDGAEELIETAECGRVIENSEDSIINNLSEILSDPDLIVNWKETAKANAHRFFKYNRIKKIESILYNYAR